MEPTIQDKLDAAKSCFEFNKDATEIFMTSELSCFFNKNNATNHASGLEKQTIDHFTRSTDAIADPVLVTPALDAVPQETPAVVTEETPAVVTEETPAVVTEETPATITEETPATVTEEIPAVVTEETPATVTEGSPVTNTEDFIKHIVEEVVDEVEKVLGVKKSGN